MIVSYGTRVFLNVGVFEKLLLFPTGHSYEEKRKKIGTRDVGCVNTCCLNVILDE
jgi:hypothetical protein